MRNAVTYLGRGHPLVGRWVTLGSALLGLQAKVDVSVLHVAAAAHVGPMCAEHVPPMCADAEEGLWHVTAADCTLAGQASADVTVQHVADADCTPAMWAAADDSLQNVVPAAIGVHVTGADCAKRCQLGADTPQERGAAGHAQGNFAGPCLAASVLHVQKVHVGMEGQPTAVTDASAAAGDAAKVLEAVCHGDAFPVKGPPDVAIG